MASDTELPTSSRTRPFRFKTKSRTSRRSKRARSPSSPTRSGSHDSRTHHTRDADYKQRERKHHRSHRPARRSRSHTRSRSPTADPRYDTGLDPDTAFRESLFDALADDEGAAYWEGVYGQPIHIYGPPPGSTMGAEGTPDGTGGDNVNAMTEEEYAAYVRQKMYEKTHEHVIEERARRAEARERQKAEGARNKEEGRRMQAESEAFTRKVEESLRRGEERRARKKWAERWERYTDGWNRLQQTPRDTAKEQPSQQLGALLPWPIASAKQADISPEGVEAFLRNAPDSLGGLNAVLKTERVRWHPDKIQQRFGDRGAVDPETLKAVTAVFQVVDRMWSETRDRKPKP